MVSVSIEIYSIVEDWFELDHCRLDDWLDAGGDEEEYMRIRDEIVQDMADEAEGDIEPMVTDWLKLHKSWEIEETTNEHIEDIEREEDE